MYGNNNYNANRYGGGNPRKRKPDQEYIQYYKKPRPQDQEEEEEIITPENELESLIFKLGDKNDISLENRLESLAAFIDAKMLSNKDEIQHLLYECISKLPEKYTIYATLLGLVNIKSYNFVFEFIEKIAKNLKELLRIGNFFVAYRLIRFVSNLVNVNVITAKSLFETFEQFLSLTTDSNSLQIRTDFYVYAVLSSLQYCGKELYEKHGPQFDQIMHTIETYINNRKKPYLPLIKVWSIDDPHPQEEYLDLLWIQMKKLEENEWNESILYRPYKKLDSMLRMSISHEFPLIIPPEHHDRILYPPPRVIFRLFDYTDVPEEFILPGAHSIERYLIEDQINLILDTYFLERKICAQQLLKVDGFSKIPIHYVIIEVIFGQLFTLPKTSHIELFYGSLLLELCRLDSAMFPQVLAQATELLFDRLDTMKASCIDRFAKWFSYHLSNFQYRWSWDDWKYCLEENIESPKCKFIKETLLNCMRLSYHQRIVEIIPESMKSLTPVAPNSFYKYETEDAVNLEGTEIANKLLELMKNRCLPEDVLQLLREIPDNNKKNDENMDHDEINDEEIIECNPVKIDVFTSTLLYFGSKSLSHIFAALAKFHMIFKTIVEDDKAQMLVIKTLHEVWKNHQQMTVIMVDKMLKTQIIECSSIANWVFSKEMREELTCFYVWEILNSTVNRMNIQVDKLQNDYNEFEDNYKKTVNSENILMENSNEDLENELKLRLENLKMLRDQQRQLFFIIIKHFIDIINECFESGNDANKKYWNKWIIERFQDFVLRYNEELYPYNQDLKNELLNSNNVCDKINEIFKMAISFKC